MHSPKYLLHLSGISLLLLLFPGLIFAGQGNCVNFDFPRAEDGRLDWPYTVKVIEQDTPLEESADSQISSVVLDFNTSLRVMEFEGSRVQVKETNAYSALGWIERSALLCAFRPEKGTLGFAKKLIVGPVDDKQRIKAYPVSDLMDCAGMCRQVEPFDGYFIFDENDDAYLLGDNNWLDDTTELLGWLPKEDGMVWKSSLGLRPAEKTACAYASLEEAAASRSEECIAIPGGTEWFLSSMRLPLLGVERYQEKNFYRVLLTLPDEILTKMPRAEQRIPFEAYIPVTEQMTSDVWLKVGDFDKWLVFLRGFAEFSNIYSMRHDNLREQFVFALSDALQESFGRSPGDDTEIPLRQYLQKVCGLPQRNDSPVFRYSIEELMDTGQVPDCEIARLLEWLNISRQMLEIVYRGDRQPLFEREDFPGECPSGDDIPFIPGEIRSGPLDGEPNMRFDHDFQKVHFYWVPKEYLP